MAVIVREKRVLGGKTFEGVKIYKSDQILTKEMKKEAEKLDIFLKNKMEEIRKGILKEFGSFDSGSEKTLRLRYELGRKLCFVDDPKIILPDDRKYIWRALFDHAQDLAPGPPDERANNRPETSFFCYCHRLGQFSWEMVESVGDWSSWQRFFDLSISKDERILKWLGQARERFQSAFKNNWLKETTKLLTRQFHDRDTLLLTDEELYKELEEILGKIEDN